MEKIFELSLITWSLMKETAFWFLVGLIIAGLIHQFIPEKIIFKLLGGRGLVPLFWACILCILLPVCSCGIIPIALALHKKGVSTGASLALCVAAPAINPAAIGLALKILGIEITLGYVVTVGIAAILVGYFANRFVPRIQHIGKAKCGCGGHHDHNISHNHNHDIDNMKGFSGFKWAFNNLAVELAPALVYGFLVAGVFMVIIPSNVIQLVLGVSGLIAYPITALIGILMFVCNVGAIPLVASLISQGAIPSIAIILLITGPATNTGQLFMLNKAFGREAMILYVILLPIISIFGASFFHRLYPTLEVSVHMGGKGGHGSTAWGIIFIGILIAALLKRGHNH